MYPFCYQCAKNYESRWKFDKVIAKTILHSFLRHGVEIIIIDVVIFCRLFR